MVNYKRQPELRLVVDPAKFQFFQLLWNIFTLEITRSSNAAVVDFYAYQVLVPSLYSITLVLNWSMFPLVIPVFALKRTQHTTVYSNIDSKFMHCREKRI